MSFFYSNPQGGCGGQFFLSIPCEFTFTVTFAASSGQNFGEFVVLSLPTSAFALILACAEYDSTQANTAQSHQFRKYFRENEFLSKPLSEAQMASIHEIKNDIESRDTAPAKLAETRNN